MEPAQIGARVRVFRELHGLKQADVAERCGWTASKQSRLEHGKLPLTVDDLATLARVLGVPLAVLLTPGPAGSTIAPGRGLQIPIPQGDARLTLVVTLRAGVLEIRLATTEAEAS
jgi:transcriptional regulator with XRE-family HTH domain